jgi:hypothetical protein
LQVEEPYWFLFLSQLFKKLIQMLTTNSSKYNCNMDTNQPATNTTQSQTQTQPQAQPQAQFSDWMDDDDDFDLIEFGIASNGGRLRMK